LVKVGKDLERSLDEESVRYHFPYGLFFEEGHEESVKADRDAGAGGVYGFQGAQEGLVDGEGVFFHPKPFLVVFQEAFALFTEQACRLVAALHCDLHAVLPSNHCCCKHSRKRKRADNNKRN